LSARIGLKLSSGFSSPWWNLLRLLLRSAPFGLFPSSCGLHLFLDLALLVFILSLFERHDGANRLLNPLEYLFLLHFALFPDSHLEQCTE